MLLQIDGTFIVIGASFIIFMLIMQVIFYGPMLKMKQQRQDYIDENQRHAKVMTEAANNFIESQEKELQETRGISKEIMAKAVEEANAKKEKAVKEASDKASQAYSEAKEKIAQSKQQTKESLKDEVSVLADSIVSQILD